MLILKSDHRVITSNAKYSYLVNNYIAGVTSLGVVNANGLAVNDYVLIGSFGSEAAEILKIESITNGILTFKTEAGVTGQTTAFAHPESTKITVIPYNRVVFYYEATDIACTFANPLTSATSALSDITPSDWFTTYTDNTNSTGYGFFRFYNSTTTTYSAVSNPIPYAGFENNTVKESLDAFFSLLNNNELKLITNTEALSWMNEGYSIMYNELNLVNNEFSASASLTLSVTAGTSEYLLQDDFSDLLSITDAQNFPVDYIKIGDIPSYTGLLPRYYIRGKYIGFVPTPPSDAAYTYRYAAKAAKLTSYDDVVNLPNDAYYMLKDFMIYRAYQKLKYPTASEFFKLFNNSLNNMKVASIKRSANKDSMGIDEYALV